MLLIYFYAFPLLSLLHRNFFAFLLVMNQPESYSSYSEQLNPQWIQVEGQIDFIAVGGTETLTSKFETKSVTQSAVLCKAYQ